jgi:hypothetical protein
MSIYPEFLSYLLSAMDGHTRCVPKGRDFDNPRRQPGARRPIKPLVAPTGRYDGTVSIGSGELHLQLPDYLRGLAGFAENEQGFHGILAPKHASCNAGSGEWP